MSGLALLGGCGDDASVQSAQAFAQMMVCPLPHGVVERPFLRDIDPRDQAKINLGVRAIEVLRRRNPGAGWDFAGLDFFTTQTPILVAKGLMQEDVAKVGTWIELERQGKKQFKAPINEVVSGVVNDYLAQCHRYVDGLKWLDGVLVEAEKIDPEVAQALLKSGKRIPCGVSNVPKCRP
ncbi:MAG: hypothetical protein RI907_1199 [Pseudomonadota bacterium]